MKRVISLVTLVVREYDEAIAYFSGILGFFVREDTTLAPGRRWVVVAPDEHDGSGILLAKAGTPDQEASIGRQCGGRVFLFLRTNDFSLEYNRMKAAGVHFVDEPRSEPYGMVVVF